MARRATALLAATVVLVALAVSGCSRSGTGPPLETVRLEPSAGCEELGTHLREAAQAARGSSVVEDGAEIASPEAARGASPDPEASTTGGTPTFSTTNVQDEGVDEPDVVETDGDTIYAVSGTTLRAVAVGEGLRLLDELPLERPGAELLLLGDRLLVLSGTGDVPVGAEPALVDRGVAADVAAPAASGAFALLVDVSEPADLGVLDELTFDGSLLSARATAGRVHVVVRSRPRVLPEESSGQAWLPDYERRPRGGAASSGPLVRCEDVLEPRAGSGVGTVTVATLEPADGLEPRASTAVVTDGRIVYASSERLYVSTAEAWPGSGVADQTTGIHAFDLTTPGGAEYVASGAVEGRLLDQFAMSEHDGVLRVASTTSGFEAAPDVDLGAETMEPIVPPASESFVTTLAEHGDELVELGRVGGLGRGEDLHSVRFLGETGYVVTFRRTDPLYTVDLTVPSAPRVRGELKILGYSAYLHPVGDGLLLGIGQDATAEGRLLGSQASLFDVSDPADPRRIDQLPLGEGSSAVESDHHAFLYWAPARLAVVPVDDVSGRAPIGARGMRLSADGLTDAGSISHPVEEAASRAHAARILRSVVVDDALYTLSAAGLLRSDLETLDEAAWLAFE